LRDDATDRRNDRDERNFCGLRDDAADDDVHRLPGYAPLTIGGESPPGRS